MSGPETSPVPGVELVHGYRYNGTTYANESDAISAALLETLGNAGVVQNVKDKAGDLVPMLARLLELNRS